MIVADREFRDAMRARRRAIPAAQRIAAAEQLARQLLSLPLLPASGRVAGYWAVDGEIGLHAFLLGLSSALTYCLPVIEDNHVMRFAAWRPGQPLATNRFGIPEPDVAADQLIHPSELDLTIVPVVAFDPTGQRVGMGGGWYDRAFAFRQTIGTPTLIGVAYDEQRVDAIAAHDWDVPMDGVCTPTTTVHAACRPSS